MPQAHPINNPIIDAAKRELADRAQMAAPLRTANDAYNGPTRIVSINTSEHKGTRKSPVADGHDTVIEQFGLASDAHAGHWHRQVSFIAAESIQTAQARGLDVHEGEQKNAEDALAQAQQLRSEAQAKAEQELSLIHI